MERCKTCKHWKTSDRDNARLRLGLGRCGATPMFWDSTKWTDDGERTWTAEAENNTAFVQDGSDYLADLYTKPNHGCTMHERA